MTMTEWRKSTYSTGGGGTTECVEVAELFESMDAQARDRMA